jgi:hypothetical protein
VYHHAQLRPRLFCQLERQSPFLKTQRLGLLPYTWPESSEVYGTF